MVAPTASSCLLRPSLRTASRTCFRPSVRCNARRSFTSTPPSSASAFVERRRQRARDVAAAGSTDPEVIEALRKAYYKKRMVISIAGLIVSGIGMWGVLKYAGEIEESKEDGDALQTAGATTTSPKTDKTGSSSVFSKVKLDGPAEGVMVVEGQKKFLDGVEQVDTGNKVVPTFPKTMRIPKSLGEPGTLDSREPGAKVSQKAGVEMEEYQLLGTGVRFVSFLSFHVYVLGMYVATSDLQTLQKTLLTTAVAPAPDSPGPVVTSLVPGEREGLKELLLDGEKGPERWDRIIKDTKIKTIFRIVPTRNTDMSHLRDSWVKTVSAKAQEAKAAAAAAGIDEADSEFADPSLQGAIADLKTLGISYRKSVPKGEAVMLLRGRTGTMELLMQPPNKPTAPLTWLGCVKDERISRVLWAKYLAGKVVASEEARQNIVGGMMALVERPTGAVEQRVL
ncbi:Chalcone isomerase, subgroup [Ascosphaera apis ARSEF 7405]|uniref:Chalcone isomerase, subgroup n=1 Tax=Ascosphaera apis ARSEF 7405 TaxID=392613 RepID=A0A167XF25_9EURO|nr:Chalcone isomerase, subgroup [Ascosphaera apis ARSEF 7405]